MNGISYEETRQMAVAVIESLRAGIPTRASTRALPDLRPNLKRLVQADLDAFQGGDQALPGRLLWGQYGQGKTHALTAIEHLALDQDFATSRVSLSREVSLHNLFHFYRRVAPIVRLPDSQAPGILGPLNRRRRSELEGSLVLEPGRYCHPLPAIVLQDLLAARDSEDQANLYGDLMGNRIPLGELRHLHKQTRQEPLPKFEENFRATRHAAAYLGLMADAIRFCGYRGWVLLIDEAELIGRLGRASRMRAYLNLHFLLGWSATLPYPVYTIAAVASRLQDDLWHGKIGSSRTDPVLLPQMAEEKCGHIESLALSRFFQQAMDPVQCPTVRPLREEDLLLLLERVRQLHADAYAWPAELDLPQLIASIGEQPVRTHLRAALEALDVKRAAGETIHPQAVGLLDPSWREDLEQAGQKIGEDSNDPTVEREA
jgi:hypothetical protein